MSNNVIAIKAIIWQLAHPWMMIFKPKTSLNFKLQTLLNLHQKLMNLFIPGFSCRISAESFPHSVLSEAYFTSVQHVVRIYNILQSKWQKKQKKKLQWEIDEPVQNWSILACVMNLTLCDFSFSAWSVALPGDGCSDTLLSDFSLERGAWQKIDAGLY